ncbi:hypothetical protein ACA910_015912 [Epithemia clementina (nom. ined.)]
MSKNDEFDGITSLPQAIAIVNPTNNNTCNDPLYEPYPVLLGYDVVQYHRLLAPPSASAAAAAAAVRGRSEYATNFQGYQFWFATAANRDDFEQDPWRFAPAWGGFDSWGVAQQVPPEFPWNTDFLGPPADPFHGWHLVKNESILIFTKDEESWQLFSQDLDRNMKLAAYRWTHWFGDLHAGPFNTHCIGPGTMRNLCLEPLHPDHPSPWLDPLPPSECSKNGSSNNTTKTSPSLGSFLLFNNHNIPLPQQPFVVVVIVLVLVLLVSFGCIRVYRANFLRTSHDPIAQQDDNNYDDYDDGDIALSSSLALSSSTTTLNNPPVLPPSLPPPPPPPSSSSSSSSAPTDLT